MANNDETQTTHNYLVGDEALLGGFVNQKRAMQLLNCKTTTLYNLRKAKLLVFSKIGSKVFYEVESIRILLKSNIKQEPKVA